MIWFAAVGEDGVKNNASLKILIVDDDQTTLAVTRALLEELGHEVLVRDRALGTTSVIVRAKPDIVLLDVEMPALKGDELLRLLKQRPGSEKARYILFSGRNREGLDELARRCGAVGAIAKSGDHEQFVRDFQALVQRATTSSAS